MVRQFGTTAALCRSHGGVYLGASAIVLYEGIYDPSTLEIPACRGALAFS
jgi:hypothetical protein